MHGNDSLLSCKVNQKPQSIYKWKVLTKRVLRSLKDLLALFSCKLHMMVSQNKAYLHFMNPVLDFVWFMSLSSAGDICRVCRSEGTQDKPLYHPCVCTGSIKFIHQEWYVLLVGCILKHRASGISLETDWVLARAWYIQQRGAEPSITMGTV